MLFWSVCWVSSIYNTPPNLFVVCSLASFEQAILCIYIYNRDTRSPHCPGMRVTYIQTIISMKNFCNQNRCIRGSYFIQSLSWNTIDGNNNNVLHRSSARTTVKNPKMLINILLTFSVQKKIYSKKNNNIFLYLSSYSLSPTLLCLFLSLVRTTHLRSQYTYTHTRVCNDDCAMMFIV